MINQIVLDMDNVLSDFHKSALKICGLDPNTIVDTWNFWEDHNINTDDFWNMIRGKSFWFNLEPKPWMHDLVDYIKSTGINWVVGTSPCWDSNCYAGKAEWLEKHLNLNPSKDAMMGSQKHLMANNNTVLIDDSEKNCEKFVNRGGHSILFPATNNKYSKLVGQELNYVKGRLNNLLNE